MKRKTIRLLLALCAAVSWLGKILIDKTTADCLTNIPKPPEEANVRPPVARSPEEKERDAMLSRLKWAISRVESCDEIGMLWSLGQLSKLCDWVVVGTVETIKPAGKHDYYGQVTILTDASLYGKLSQRKVTFDFGVNSRDNFDGKPGDRMLVFLTDKNLIVSDFSSPRTFRFPSFNFDRSKNAWEKLKQISLCSPEWAYIFLGGKGTEQEVRRTVKGYLDVFGEGGKRDSLKYVEFLCSLLSSPVERIRTDAGSDLILFFEQEDISSDMLDKLLSDERVRAEVKDYLRFRLRNEKSEEEK